MRVKELRAATIERLPPPHKISVRWHCLCLAGCVRLEHDLRTALIRGADLHTTIAHEACVTPQ